MSEKWHYSCASCNEGLPAHKLYLLDKGRTLCYQCLSKPVQNNAVTPERHDQSEALDAEMSPEELVTYYGFSSVHEMRKAIGATE